MADQQTRISSDSGEILARPIFGEPLPKGSIWPDIFTLMPFGKPFDAIYQDHILPVLRGLNVTCKRADDFFSTQAVIKDIWSAIYYSTICIADCSNRNPNVFYELGIAHTLGRSTILITQSIDDVPFDVKHRRVITYTYDPPGMKDFEEALRKTLLHELGPFISSLQTDMLLAQAVDKYLNSIKTDQTKSQYSYRIQSFLEWRALQEMAPLAKQVEQYIHYLEEEQLASLTIKGYFGPLKGLIKTLTTIDIRFAADLLKLDEIEMPAETPSKPRILPTQDQIQILVDMPGTATTKGLRDTCILRLITEMGFRRSDIVNLRYGHLTVDHESVVIERNGELLFVSHDLSKLLSQWIVESAESTEPDVPVFCAITNQAKIIRREQGLTGHAIYKMVQEYARLAGLPDVTPSSLS